MAVLRSAFKVALVAFLCVGFSKAIRVPSEAPKVDDPHSQDQLKPNADHLAGHSGHDGLPNDNKVDTAISIGIGGADSNGSGYNNGIGYGNGNGGNRNDNGNGNGVGNGNGNGNGNGYGSGTGYGNRYGNDYGNGYGYRSGYQNGYNGYNNGGGGASIGIGIGSNGGSGGYNGGGGMGIGIGVGGGGPNVDIGPGCCGQNCYFQVSQDSTGQTGGIGAPQERVHEKEPKNNGDSEGKVESPKKETRVGSQAPQVQA